MITDIRERAGEKRDFLIECDVKNCNASLDARDRTWQQMVRFMDVKGWKKRKVYGSWIHTCPDCTAKQFSVTLPDAH